METTENNSRSNDSLLITNAIREDLLEIAKWAKFLAILGFIGFGIMVLAALIALGAGSSIRNLLGIGGVSILPSLILAILAVLYFFPLKYLYQAASNFKQSVNATSQDLLTSGFRNLKSHYRFVGILTIVVLSIYALIIIVGIIGFSLMGI